MAMLDRFQGLFKKKAGDEPDLSNATDQEVAELAAARLAPKASSDGFGGSPMVDEDEDNADRAGSLTFGLVSDAYTVLQTPGNISTNMSTTGQAQVTVAYDYTIPELTTMVLLGLGGLLFRHKS